MCRSLTAAGVETLLATTDADGDAHLDVPLGAATTWKGAPAIFFRRDCSEAFKYSRGLGAWLRRHVGDFDVVHAHAALSYAPIAAGRAATARAIPYVVRPLGTLDNWSLAQKPAKKQALLRLGGRRLLLDASLVQYTSRQERREVESAFGIANGAVVPLGVDDNLLHQPVVRASERFAQPYVLALSRLHPVKNLERLIQAFSDVVSADDALSHWRLIIAGDGDPDYTSALKQLASRGRAATSVVFRGWTEAEAKRDLVSRASLYALPSFHENFGVSLIEAMAASVPVLVSRGVHLCDEVEAAGAGWVVGDDLDSLRTGLADALSSFQELARRGESARTAAARFTWSSVAGQLIEIYRNVSRSERRQ